MNISEESQIELNDALLDLELPHVYGIFARKWIAFNRVYNEVSKKREEWARVEAVGDALQEFWHEEEIQHLVIVIKREANS